MQGGKKRREEEEEEEEEARSGDNLASKSRAICIYVKSIIVRGVRLEAMCVCLRRLWSCC